jgi:hypothetical protein
MQSPGYRIYIAALTLLFVFHSATCTGKGAGYIYDYNENCSKAYQCYMSMHFASADALVSNELSAHPNNLMAVYLADYEDCLVLLLNSDKDEYDRRKSHFEERMELLDKGDEGSPWYRFCKAGIYMHWAMSNAEFGDQFRAAVKFRKSFLLIKENERLFPGFEYNHIFSGLEEAAIGALPGNYQWMASVFGISGNIKNGTAQLAAFVNSHTPAGPLYTEAMLYYVYVNFYLAGEQKKAWDFLNNPLYATNDNLLNTFSKAVIAVDYHKADVAIATLKSSEPEADFNKYPFLDYLEGTALLAKSGMASISYLQQYVKNNKNELYIKNSWQKMAFACYLAGDQRQAEYYRQQIKTHGNEKLDADKQAQKFAESNEWPQKKLLQARLLTDGGYYTDAFTALKDIDAKTLTDPAAKAEYFYRLGKVYQELTDNNRALEYYKYAIDEGKKQHDQFAARSALQMGIIYEHTGLPAQALERYKECLDMPSHDFKNAIDQQAKAGVNRLEK